jgi:hypothetical protein
MSWIGQVSSQPAVGGHPSFFIEIEPQGRAWRAFPAHACQLPLTADTWQEQGCRWPARLDR